MNRRDFLSRSALSGASLGLAWSLSGCRSNPLAVALRQHIAPAPPDWRPLPHDADRLTQATHVLNRVAFGPRPGDAARVAEVGTAAYLEEQLDDRLDEDAGLTWRVNGLDTQQIEQDAPDALASMSDDQLTRETAQVALLRAVYSRHQLRETLADFWTNHFNIYALKNEGRWLVPVDAERAIRPHVLTTFHDLLHASAHSPAMLAYLDNNQNRRGVANENYARELLELHTLGVHSGYTQRDIQEVARAFTGWTVTTGWTRGQYRYDGSQHDQGAKYIPFLNLTLTANGGEKDADTVLERLALHPATARFVATKLCRHYLGDAPEARVDAAAQAYLRSHSDIRQTLRPILLDGLHEPADNKPILKRPLDFAASALRALGADTDGSDGLQKALGDMGQPLYEWPMPDGFPEKTTAWTGSLLPRWNFALSLTSNGLSGTTCDLQAPLHAARAHTDDALLDTLVETVYSRPHDTPGLQTTRQALARHLENARRAGMPDATVVAETAALLLCAPPFQWK